VNNFNVTILNSVLTAKVVYDICSRCSKCPPFAATQAPGASLQGEDPDCGGDAAAQQAYGERERLTSVSTHRVDNAVKQLA